MGTSMSRTKICNKHLFLSGAQQCDEVPSAPSWQAYQGRRQTPAFVPPVADGPGVSLISACGDGEPRLSPDARYQRSHQQDQPCQDGTITTFLFRPAGTTAMGNGPWGVLAQRREHDTTRGGARFQWPFVATSFHAADPTVDPNQDADIRIGSEAPKQRCPFLYPA